MNKRKSSRVAHNEVAANERIALLLSGGDGTRLKDLTREIVGISIPKQYCRLYNNSSLLETTIARTRLYVPSDRIHIVINRDHTNLAMDQVRELPESNVFIQPANRDTGPGLIFSLLQLQQVYPDAIISVFPTDHFIDDNRAFIAHTLRATRLVARMPDKIAILGIVPDRPETGYGYLLPDNPVKSYKKTYHVKAFCEKPDISGAYEIMSSGALWNTFVMVFKLSRMLDILNRIIPEKITAFKELIRSPNKAAKIYRTISPWNFSNQVLTQIPQHILMMEVDNIRWSDWGTRELIERTYRALNKTPFWEHPPHQPVRSEREPSNQDSSSQFIA